MRVVVVVAGALVAVVVVVAVTCGTLTTQLQALETSERPKSATREGRAKMPRLATVVVELVVVVVVVVEIEVDVVVLAVVVVDVVVKPDEVEVLERKMSFPMRSGT